MPSLKTAAARRKILSWPERELATRGLGPKIGSAYWLEAVFSLAEEPRAAFDSKPNTVLEDFTGIRKWL